jgi:activating signal cointegrator 1
MKALSLLQPYASLVIYGFKKVETRSWRTSYRGLLAIHSSKSWMEDYWYMCAEEPFRSALKQMGINPDNPVALPLGQVLGTVDLDHVGLIKPDYRVSMGMNFIAVHEPERSFGDYTPDRFGWMLHDPKRFDEPIPARGKQGLWEWVQP